MMGHRSKRFKLFTETNLEALLPADNFYRQLEGKLDLSFVRDLVRDLYGEMGRRSIDPVVFETVEFVPLGEDCTRIVGRFRLVNRGRVSLLAVRPTRPLFLAFWRRAGDALRSTIEEDAVTLGDGDRGGAKSRP